MPGRKSAKKAESGRGVGDAPTATQDLNRLLVDLRALHVALTATLVSASNLSIEKASNLVDAVGNIENGIYLVEKARDWMVKPMTSSDRQTARPRSAPRKAASSLAELVQRTRRVGRRIGLCIKSLRTRKLDIIRPLVRAQQSVDAAANWIMRGLMSDDDADSATPVVRKKIDLGWVSAKDWAEFEVRLSSLRARASRFEEDLESLQTLFLSLVEKGRTSEAR